LNEPVFNYRDHTNCGNSYVKLPPSPSLLRLALTNV
jgi:hypothetical protein